MNKPKGFEELMQRLTDEINSDSESYGFGAITAAQVASAIQSLERDGYAFEYVVARVELIARRILRINPFPVT